MFTMLTILLVESDVQWIFGANADTNIMEKSMPMSIYRPKLSTHFLQWFLKFSSQTLAKDKDM